MDTPVDADFDLDTALPALLSNSLRNKFMRLLGYWPRIYQSFDEKGEAIFCVTVKTEEDRVLTRVSIEFDYSRVIVVVRSCDD